MKRTIGSLTLLAFAVACGPRGGHERAVSSATASEMDEESWRSELLAHRREVDEEFRTSPESPMASAQYLKSEPAEKVYLVLEAGTFELTDSPVAGAQLSVARQGSSWHWQKLEADVVGRAQGEEVADGAAFEGPAEFTIGDFHLSFYPSEDRVTFIVFDPRRPEMRSFEHLLYFPPDRKYAVDARLELIAEPDEIAMPTTRNLIKTFYRYAKLHFEIDGQQQELTALKSALEGEGSEGLFIPFKDATTGRETYGAGRYLMIDDPQSESFVLDFNRAFNPLCNYSPAYNCTLPPRENHLEVAIRAGEKTYPH